MAWIFANQLDIVTGRKYAGAGSGYNLVRDNFCLYRFCNRTFVVHIDNQQKITKPTGSGKFPPL
jgi:hypothetical protein